MSSWWILSTWKTKWLLCISFIFIKMNFCYFHYSVMFARNHCYEHEQLLSLQLVFSNATSHYKLSYDKKKWLDGLKNFSIRKFLFIFAHLFVKFWGLFGISFLIDEAYVTSVTIGHELLDDSRPLSLWDGLKTNGSIIYRWFLVMNMKKFGF